MDARLDFDSTCNTYADPVTQMNTLSNSVFDVWSTMSNDITEFG